MRRLGRTAIILCALMALVALAVAGPRAAVAVVGGGVLIGVSFVALASGTGALASLVSGQAGPDRARVMRVAMIRLVGRYALLGILAYVMIARLRLHPVGLLAGASSVAAAAFVEAARFLLNGSKRSSRTSSPDRRYR